MTEIPEDSIFGIKTQNDFQALALEIYNHQFHKNKIYRDFTSFLHGDQAPVSKFEDIPFLPVEFFRNHTIVTGDRPVETVFESSGTTGTSPGRHHVTDLKLYETSFLKGFNIFYGHPAEYIIIALLPSYTERHGSSLVYMADRLIRESSNPLSGFYKSGEIIEKNILWIAEKEDRKVLLLGVSFALLDLAEMAQYDLSRITVMETGGMKGRRKELTRSELHSILKKKFNVSAIHSEYGMTELLSQAYSKGEGVFYCPPWMRIVIRDPQDPLTIYTEHGRTGGINIIDLANKNSCSFIATGDLGRLHEDGGFEVLGRFDNSDVRGCNLMAE
jgi:hypothetical protein